MRWISEPTGAVKSCPGHPARCRSRFGIFLMMDLTKMLAELRLEREQIEEAMMTLARLARGRGNRRGRPPAWMSQLKRRGRPPGNGTRISLMGRVIQRETPMFR